MGRTGRHALVLGGSMTGLMAARVLSDHFDRVTLVERDALSQVYGHRKGVPQSLHAHALLSGGSDALERMFPGFRAGLVERGALLGDAGHVRFGIAGRWFPRVDTGLQALRLSRPLLEGHLRERVRVLPNVTFLDQCDVRGLLGNGDAIGGARIVRRDRIAMREEPLTAELVVDATGRGSKTPSWIEALGVSRVQEDRVRINLGYSSCVYRGTPAALGGANGMIIGNTDTNLRSGVAVAMEDGRILVTLAGHLGKYPPLDQPGMLEFARRLPLLDLYELIRSAEPLSNPVAARFPHRLRRRYELLKDMPSGLIVLGDALCSFSPVLGQGMSIAALQVELLDRCLRESPRASSRRFFAGAARIIDAPWRMARGSEPQAATDSAAPPLPARVIGAYMKRLIHAAGSDAGVCSAFLHVVQLQRPAHTLFAPSLVRRVLAQRAARCPERHDDGDTPTQRLNARLSAASEP